MENSTNQSQRAGGFGVLIEPSWTYAGVGVYSATVFLIVTGLYLIKSDKSDAPTMYSVNGRRLNN